MPCAQSTAPEAGSLLPSAADWSESEHPQSDMRRHSGLQEHQHQNDQRPAGLLRLPRWPGAGPG
jgi:hypothetical protein